MTTSIRNDSGAERWFGHRYLALLVALLLLFALYPFLEQNVIEARHVSVFFTVILIAGIYAVSHNHRLTVLALVLAAGMLSGQWLAHFDQNPTAIAFARVFGFVFFLVTAAAILTDVLKSRTITGDKICGAICAYLMIALMWAFLFCLIEVLNPGSFLENGQPIAVGHITFRQFAVMNSLVYYSMVTIATLGYGDIIPKTAPARSLSTLEAITGQMYLAILIARLVSIHIVHSTRARDGSK